MTEKTFQTELQAILATHDVEKLRGEYWKSDEFLYVPTFLSPLLLEPLQEELPQVRSHIHRTKLPGVRKGGSVGATKLRKETALIKSIYDSPHLKGFLSRIVDRSLSNCPSDDEHAMALYSYTEEGDFIHYHFDTSFYKGNRYTVLLTIANESSCKLMYDLYKKSAGRTVEHHEVNTTPGSLVVFNGDKVWHAVSPSRKGDQRFVLSLEYLDDSRIGIFGKLVSDLKDRIGYFGLRTKTA
ncbi:MAG: 2OG-Fe(II) oxygenase [Ignavibacteriales bacterium]|nr:2OG-Fe(II) oxygenase [Ignavibacteriales bacterium]